jgi:hypothetical protein
LTFTPSLGDWELLRLPAALSFLYYLIRPVRLAVKFGRLALTRRPGMGAGVASLLLRR